jgi:hypothetical protein
MRITCSAPSEETRGLSRQNCMTPELSNVFLDAPLPNRLHDLHPQQTPVLIVQTPLFLVYFRSPNPVEAADRINGRSFPAFGSASSRELCQQRYLPNFVPLAVQLSLLPF